MIAPMQITMPLPNGANQNDTADASSTTMWTLHHGRPDGHTSHLSSSTAAYYHQKELTPGLVREALHEQLPHFLGQDLVFAGLPLRKAVPNECSDNPALTEEEHRWPTGKTSSITFSSPPHGREKRQELRPRSCPPSSSTEWVLEGEDGRDEDDYNDGRTSIFRRYCWDQRKMMMISSCSSRSPLGTTSSWGTNSGSTADTMTVWEGEDDSVGAGEVSTYLHSLTLHPQRRHAMHRSMAFMENLSALDPNN